MKRCPQCNRTYADETISFCLADGQLLSPSFDLAATMPLGPARATDGTPTQIIQVGPSPERARMLIRRSWIVGALGVPCGVIIMLIQFSTVPGNEQQPLAALVAAGALGGLIYGYLFWSAWWGYPAVWRWWRGFIRKPLQFITSRLDFNGAMMLVTIIVGICLLAPALAIVFLYFYLLFLVGFAYSLFGGGIYQFFQAKKIARNSGI